MVKSIHTVMLGILVLSATAWGADYYVGPDGNDANPGTKDRPFATFSRAQQAARAEQATVWFRAGVYYLPETIRLTAEDSGTTFAALPAEKPVLGTGGRTTPGLDVGWTSRSVPPEAPVGTMGTDLEVHPTDVILRPVLSGGMKLDLKWEPYRDGIMQARTPAGLAIDQLFVNGQRQLMARYPNYDPSVLPYGGYAADAFSKERASRWSDPAGGFIHAMHAAHWGGYHYLITGKNSSGEVTYQGGWQNNRQMGMHPQHRYVENIFEELDAPGEWFHNAKTATLYYKPPDGVDLAKATVEVVRLRHLVEFQGTQQKPVKNVTLRGFVFRHAARTFMDTKEALLRSDWTIYRGGAVLFGGAEDCTVEGCEFDQLGGNAIFVNNYNRRVSIRGCDIHDTGASAVAFVGDPKAVRNPLLECDRRQSYADIDKTPGPQTDNYPADCLVEDCLIRRVGVVEKQVAGVEISMSMGVTVRHCSIYESPRAGINISEGTFGGHVIEFCDVFDTVLETGDHGSFNSWGRDRYWGLKDAPDDELPALALLDMVKPNVLRNNRWRCDHGWDVDLDDGSSNYEICNNLFLAGGLKLREGFHRKVWNNIAVNNSLHPHVWFEQSGDEVTGNIWMGAYRPAAMSGSLKKWGKEVDRNLFTTSDADRAKYADKGCDAHSLVGDPRFVAPDQGDFRVQDESPALKLGFQNFPMDQFGVHKPALKAIARTPEIPALGQPGAARAGRAQPATWQGAAVHGLEGEEFSAYGVSKESGGVAIAGIATGSPLSTAGIKTGDLIQSVNGKPVRSVAELLRAVEVAAGRPLGIGLVRSQAAMQLELSDYAYTVAETATGADFKVLTLAAHAAPIVAAATRPETCNEPLASLHDGKLAANYGPVFNNGVQRGLYKVDLGKATPVAEVRTWSFNQNGNRGAQHCILFGSAAASDPGWNVGDPELFMPLAETDAGCTQPFLATSVRRAGGRPLGTFRWLVWVALPVTAEGENTAFQEFQVLPPVVLGE